MVKTGVAHRPRSEAGLTTCSWAPCPKSPFGTTAESSSYIPFNSPRMPLRQLVATDDLPLNSFPLAPRQLSWRKIMKRRRYQYGSLTKKNNRLSEDVWQF